MHRGPFRGQSNPSFCVADDLDWCLCHVAFALTGRKRKHEPAQVGEQVDLFWKEWLL